LGITLSRRFASRSLVLVLRRRLREREDRRHLAVLARRGGRHLRHAGGRGDGLLERVELGLVVRAALRDVDREQERAIGARAERLAEPVIRDALELGLGLVAVVGLAEAQGRDGCGEQQQDGDAGVPISSAVPFAAPVSANPAITAGVESRFVASAVSEQPAAAKTYPPAMTGLRPTRSINRPAGTAASADAVRKIAGPSPSSPSTPVTSTKVSEETAATSCSTDE
jgi:hypothetical protein